MGKEYIADKATLDNVNSIVSAFNNRWPDARAGKVDNIQAVLNTPNGDTLAAWIRNISDSASAANSNAANAANLASQANSNAANAANLASQANSNAWNAYQEAVNAKNAAGGSVVKSVQRGVIEGMFDTHAGVNIAINAVNINKSLSILGTTHGDNIDGYSCLKLVNSTTIHLIPCRSSSAGRCKPISWQVIEFY